MREQPMRTLLRLRRLTLDEARLHLADCLDQESAAARALRAIEQSIQEETERASSLDGTDATVETFALWLRRTREALATAQARLHDAEAATHEARTVLGAARQAVEAIETELQKQEDAEQAARDRREQRVLDEVGSRVRVG